MLLFSVGRYLVSGVLRFQRDLHVFGERPCIRGRLAGWPADVPVRDRAAVSPCTSSQGRRLMRQSDELARGGLVDWAEGRPLS